jgi:hypothetical protein
MKQISIPHAPFTFTNFFQFRDRDQNNALTACTRPFKFGRSTGPSSGGLMIHKSPIAVAFVLSILVAFIPSPGLCSCVELRGVYADCEIVANHPEKFTFKVNQGFKAGEPFYAADFEREGKPQSIIFVADANGRRVLTTDGKPVAPVELTYVATCSDTRLYIKVYPALLGETTMQKFTVFREESGNLHITNQSVLLGQVATEREVTCKLKSNLPADNLN